MSERAETIRAKRALGLVRDIRDKHNARLNTEYVRVAKAFPVDVLTLGLGQALAVLEVQTKNDKGATAFRNHIVRWLQKESPYSPHKSGINDEISMQTLLTAIIEAGQSDYAASVAETIAFAGWLKKLAQAWLEERTKGAFADD